MSQELKTFLKLANSALLLLVVLGFDLAFGYVTVGGNQWGAWHSDSTYYVYGNVTVPLGRTLRIEPGVRVKFNHGKQLEIYGDLQVPGGDDPVFFTSMDDDSVGEIIAGSDGVPEPGDWDFILFQVPLSQNSYIRTSHIRYAFYGVLNFGSSVEVDSCNLYRCERYGFFNGSGHPAIINSRVYHNGLEECCSGIFSNGSSAPDVIGCEIFENGGSGFEATWTLESFQIADNLIRDNARYGIEYYDAVVIPVFSGNTISGHQDPDYGGMRSYPAQVIGNQITANTYPFLLGGNVALFDFRDNIISGNNYDSALALSGPIFGTLPEDLIHILGVYVVVGGVEVPEYKSLEIEPGVIIKFPSFQELTVLGSLSAGLNPLDSTIFTSFADDNYGGDTNADGPSSGSPGDWSSISIQESASASIRQAHIRFALTGVNVDGGDLTLKSCLVSSCREHGIWVEAGSPLIDSCTVADCRHFGIGCSGSSSFYVTNCVITSNGERSLDAGIHSPGPIAPAVEICSLSFNTGSGIRFENLDSLCGITGNLIENNSLYGIYCSGTVPPFVYGNIIRNHPEEGQCGILFNSGEVASNRFENNFFPIALSGKVGELVFKSNQFFNNSYNNVLGLKGNLSGELSGVLPQGAGSYLASDSIVVASGDTLVLNSEVVCKFRSVGVLRVEGVLLGEGEVEDGIVLTSVFDDEFGGDAGPNGPTSGTPGDWRYFVVSESEAEVDLRYTTIRFPMVGMKSTAGQAVLDRCGLSFCSEYGALLDGGTLSLAGCTLESNEGAGLYADSGNVSLNGCQILGNGGSGILSQGNIEFSVDSCVIKDNGSDLSDNGIGCYGPLAPDIVSCSIETNSGCGIYCQDTEVAFKVSATTLRDNLKHGISYQGSAAARFIGNQISGHDGEAAAAIYGSCCKAIDNSITNNTYPLIFTGDLASFRASGNTIENNTYNSALGLTGEVSGVVPNQLPDSLRAYVIIVSVTVPLEESLTVRAGAVLKFSPNSQLKVRGYLSSDGNPGSKIVYTSFSDDRFGGDTNGDGPSVGQPGDWRGISFPEEGSGGTLFYTDILYPVYGIYTTASALHVTNCAVGFCKGSGIYIADGSPSVLHTSISDCDDCGIYVRSGQPSIFGTEVNGCGRYGVYSSGEMSFTIDSCKIVNNGIGSNSPGIACEGLSPPTVRGSNIEGNAGSGIQIVGAEASYHVERCTIAANGHYGIFYTGSAFPTFRRNTITSHIHGGRERSRGSSENSKIRKVKASFSSYAGVSSSRSGSSKSENGGQLRAGIYSSAAKIDSNTISTNEVSVILTGDLGKTKLRNNTFENNVYNTVLGLSGSVWGTIQSELPDPMTAYVSLDSLVVPPGDSLFIGAGSVLKFLSRSYLRSLGKLQAKGTRNRQVVFTSINDDDYGGDNNANGPSDGKPGDWEGLKIASGITSVETKNAIIRYASTGMEVESGSATISESQLVNSLNEGLSCLGGEVSIDSTYSWHNHIGIRTVNASPVVTHCALAYNDYGVHSSDGASPFIGGCDIMGNSLFGVYNADTSITILAENNWWGHHSGP
ncbi:MAG: hypothetical protein AMJ41_01200, partial [candidate division Zixibacteria bacterium DG_27]